MDEPPLSSEESEAQEWANSFRPLERHQYDWVYDLAALRYQKLRESAKNLDDKAASIATAIGGGTGIFTLGSLAGLASGTVHWGIVTAGTLSVVFAIAAMRSTICVRRTAPFPEPPSIVYATRCVEDLSDTEPKGNPKAAFIGEWHIACEAMMPILKKKAEHLDDAFSWFCWAIFLLLAPIAVGILITAGKPEKPMEIRIVSPIPQGALTSTTSAHR